MPTLLEKREPLIATPTRPPFVRRLAVSTLRLLVIASISALVGGGWYLAKKGFGSKWRSLVVEELHKRGVEASFAHLTLDPFRGLVAQDVRIFDYKHRENTLALISEVSLDINYANLFHHRPFLNALDVRNAQLTLPIAGTKGKTEKPQLKNFRAHVYFPPEQIYVSQAEGYFCGVRISATGQLIKRDNYPSSPPLSEEEWQKRMAILQGVVAELQKFSFPAEHPSLQVKFSGDLADMENARVEATLRGERVQRGGYEMRDLVAMVEFSDQRLTIPQFEWKDATGGFYGRGSWSRRTQAMDFQAHSDINLKSFLEAVGLEKPLADATFTSSPVIDISGTGNFGEGRPRIRVTGNAAASNFSYGGVPLIEAALNFSWDGERTLLRDIRLRHQNGQMNAELLDAPNDFRLDIDSAVNPSVFRSFVSADMRQFLNDWQWQQPPRIHLAIRGADHEPGSWRGDGNITLDRTRFRGVWLNNASAKIHFEDGAISYQNLRVARDEGTATGEFTYDFKKHEVRISNIRSSLRPADAIAWVDPKLVKTVTPYRFRQPPNIVTNGVYQFDGGKGTRLDLAVDAPGGMDYVFLGKNLPFDRIAGKLTFTNDRLQIADLKGTLFSGTTRGGADISLAKNDSRYRANINVANIDFPKLTDLYFQYKTSQGQLNGKYTFTGVGADARTMRGNGSLDVTNGDVFAIPIFGPLSGILNNIIPGTGYSIARKASANFTIKDGVMHTDDFEAAGKLFSLVGRGDIYFLDDKLNFEMRVNANGPGALLQPMYKLFEYVGEGSLKKPDWHPKRF